MRKLNPGIPLLAVSLLFTAGCATRRPAEEKPPTVE